MPTPHFLIIGTQKGGTSSLYQLLAQHPQILPAARKEVHFFDQHYAQGPAWYRQQFPDCSPTQITGEASPFYMAHPLAAQRIHALIPTVKLIVLLRNPAQRAYSHYQHMCRRQLETLPFTDALAQEEKRTAASWSALESGELLEHSNAQRFSYRKRGCYAEQLARYFQLFPRQQIGIWQSERFFSDTLPVLEEILAFLDLPTGFIPPDMTIRKPGHYDSSENLLINELKTYYQPFNETLFTLIKQHFDWQ